MSRFCPLLQEKVVYLTCMECEEDCEHAQKRQVKKPPVKPEDKQ